MPRCEHGYDHHSGPHACDMHMHLDKCPYWEPDKPLDSTAVRTERLDHNHIFQATTVNGYWDCPACQTIDPLRMRWEYGQFYHGRLIRDRLL